MVDFTIIICGTSVPEKLHDRDAVVDAFIHSGTLARPVRMSRSIASDRDRIVGIDHIGVAPAEGVGKPCKWTSLDAACFAALNLAKKAN
jgi:hypothetical protein